MSTPQANTFSYDFSLDAEYPVRFRFPVTWRCISGPLDSAAMQYSAPPQMPVSAPRPLPPPEPRDVRVVAQPKPREPLAPPGSGAQWEMVIPKMARPVRSSAQNRLLPAAGKPQPDRAPTLSTLPRSRLASILDAVPLKWKLFLLAAVTISLILWAWSGSSAPKRAGTLPLISPVSTMRVFAQTPDVEIFSRSVQC